MIAAPNNHRKKQKSDPKIAFVAAGAVEDEAAPWSTQRGKQRFDESACVRAGEKFGALFQSRLAVDAADLAQLQALFRNRLAAVNAALAVEVRMLFRGVHGHDSGDRLGVFIHLEQARGIRLVHDFRRAESFFVVFQGRQGLQRRKRFWGCHEGLLGQKAGWTENSPARGGDKLGENWQNRLKKSRKNLGLTE